jgi:hypothetical protein
VKWDYERYYEEYIGWLSPLKEKEWSEREKQIGLTTVPVFSFASL